MSNNNLSIIDTERELTCDIEAGGFTFHIKGKADRIDRNNGMIRIIDYKTGTVKNDHVKVPKVITSLKEMPDKAVQLLIYKYLYLKNHPEVSPDQVTAAIYGLRYEQIVFNIKVDNQEEKKIGFGDSQPDEKEIKRTKIDDTLPGKSLRIPARVLMIFGIILSSLTLMYFLLPIFSAFIGALLAVILVFFMIFSVIFTIGMVLMIDGYRNWIGNHMMDVPNFFFKISEHIANLSPYFLVVAIPAIIFCTSSLIISIIGMAEKKPRFLGFIIVDSIFLAIALFFTILFIIAGGKVFSF